MLRTRSFGTVEVTSVDRDALLAALGAAAAQLGREHSEVEAVHLFGSFARGDYTPDSDVDLLVIVTDTDVPFLARPDRFRSAFSAIPLDVNLTVYTRREAEDAMRVESSFLRRVLSEAMDLLDR